MVSEAVWRWDRGLIESPGSICCSDQLTHTHTHTLTHKFNPVGKCQSIIWFWPVYSEEFAQPTEHAAQLKLFDQCSVCMCVCVCVCVCVCTMRDRGDRVKWKQDRQQEWAMLFPSKPTFPYNGFNYEGNFDVFYFPLPFPIQHLRDVQHLCVCVCVCVCVCLCICTHSFTDSDSLFWHRLGIGDVMLHDGLKQLILILTIKWGLQRNTERWEAGAAQDKQRVFIVSYSIFFLSKWIKIKYCRSLNGSYYASFYQGNVNLMFFKWP